MESWSIDRLRRPFLNVDAVELVDSGSVIEIRAEHLVYRMVCDSQAEASEITEQLRLLRDCNAPLWGSMRNDGVDSPWRELLEILDARSLIGERTHAKIEDRPSDLEARIRLLQCEIMSGLTDVECSVAAQIAATLHRRMENASSHHDPLEAVNGENFFVTVAEIELSYLVRRSPAAMAASLSLLRIIAADNAIDFCPSIFEADQIPSGLYDDNDIGAHLYLVAHCIRASTQAGAKRFSVPTSRTEGGVPGLEFLRRAELMARATLERWGENNYVMAIRTPNPKAPLIAGCYIEQYHVTRRFVEIITPILSKRLSKPIRQLMFQYFGEEIGHEVFERETVQSLGVSQEMLDRSIPLPLVLAFVDALTVVAEHDPVTFFAAVMVTEGMLGDASVVSERLSLINSANASFRQVSSRHDRLNHDLNHASIARLAFSHIAALTGDCQQSALSRLGFLLELNHRAWNSVAAFYGSQDVVQMHDPFGDIGGQESPSGETRDR